MQPQSTTHDLTLKQKIGWVLLLALLCAVPLGYTLKTQNDARIAKEAQRVALVEKEQAEAAKQAKVAAAKVGKTKKKRKGKMVKIAIGTMKQADYIAENSAPGNSNGFEIYKGTLVANTANPNGWATTELGLVSVPEGASSGTYQMNTFEANGDGTITVRGYEFEVVCMTVKLRPYTRAIAD